jgi:anti-sigma factor RsiW
VNCPQTRNLINAFLDGQLDLVRHLEIEHHLAECPACADNFKGLQSLRDAVRAEAPYHRAPPGLLERFRSRQALPSETSPASLAPRRWFGLAVALAAGVVLALGGLGLVLFRAPQSPNDLLVKEVIAGHVHSLLAHHLTDVASSDRHTVKPWFKGQVDFAPQVPDLSDHDFTLVGGRLDYLDNRPVAALVYRRRAHVINLFVWPASQRRDSGPTTGQRQGYNYLHWVAGEMNGWAVSDLNAEELREFARLVGCPGGPGN